MKLGVVRRLEKAQRLQSDCLTADVCTSRSSMSGSGDGGGGRIGSDCHAKGNSTAA